MGFYAALVCVQGVETGCVQLTQEFEREHASMCRSMPAGCSCLFTLEVCPMVLVSSLLWKVVCHYVLKLTNVTVWMLSHDMTEKCSATQDDDSRGTQDILKCWQTSCLSLLSFSWVAQYFWNVLNCLALPSEPCCHAHATMSALECYVKPLPFA